MRIVKVKQIAAYRIGHRAWTSAWTSAWAGVWLCSFVLAGCGSGVYQSAPVDEDKASETLLEVMESWKEGETPDSLQEQSPKIVVQDFDWLSGMKLLSYEVVGESKAVDANLIARVKLTLQDKTGNELEKTVTYVVGTSPVLTVFRDMLK